MKFKPTYVFLMLSVSFLLYSVDIYIKPMFASEELRFDKKKASQGRLVWQKYNCQSCHQLYSLGGYLGPDLTNIFSKPGKGETVIRAMVNSGVKQMPAFKLSDSEMNSLIEFLKSTDASGTADLRKFKIDDLGMMDLNEDK